MNVMNKHNKIHIDKVRIIKPTEKSNFPTIVENLSDFRYDQHLIFLGIYDRYVWS